MTPGPGIEPGTHWWKASALTTTPTLLPIPTLLPNTNPAPQTNPAPRGSGISRGAGGSWKNPFHGEVWIFSGITH